MVTFSAPSGTSELWAFLLSHSYSFFSPFRVHPLFYYLNLDLLSTKKFISYTFPTRTPSKAASEPYWRHK